MALEYKKAVIDVQKELEKYGLFKEGAKRLMVVLDMDVVKLISNLAIDNSTVKTNVINILILKGYEKLLEEQEKNKKVSK